MAIEQLRFDYAALDTETRAFVQEKAHSIHARLKRTAEDIIAIGQDLIEVQGRLSTGGRGGIFLTWIQQEFGMSQATAYRFMQVARRLGKFITVINFPAKVLYELASPSTPEPVIEMVTTGQIPATIPAIRESRQDFSENDAVLAGYRGYEQWQEAQLWEEKRREGMPAKQPPSFEQWQSDNVALGLDRFGDTPEKELEPIIQAEKTEQRNAHVMRVMGSSESPEWYTPFEIVSLVLAYFDGKIDLDPCSNSHETPNIPAQTLYTREDNGLAHDWHGKVYMNPPYGAEIPAWIEKLVYEYEEARHIEEALILIPARIDTQWFQPLYAYPMCHIRGRLQFENAQYSAPFPSIVVYLGRRPENFIEFFKDLGPIMRRIG